MHINHIRGSLLGLFLTKIFLKNAFFFQITVATYPKSYLYCKSGKKHLQEIFLEQCKCSKVADSQWVCFLTQLFKKYVSFLDFSWNFCRNLFIKLEKILKNTFMEQCIWYSRLILASFFEHYYLKIYIYTF